MGADVVLNGCETLAECGEMGGLCERVCEFHRQNLCSVCMCVGCVCICNNVGRWCGIKDEPNRHVPRTRACSCFLLLLHLLQPTPLPAFSRPHLRVLLTPILSHMCVCTACCFIKHMSFRLVYCVNKHPLFGCTLCKQTLNNGPKPPRYHCPSAFS